MKSRSDLVVLLGVCLVLVVPAMQGRAADGGSGRRPNIVYILADDLGYGDLGSYGQQLIRTPRLDRMAAEGMRFTQHYAGAPSCHPSRCVLFTGKHTGHARIRANSKRPLHADDFTLSQMFQQAGYATGGVGKWSLGDADTISAPWRIGMDEFFGYLDQTHAHTYYPDFLWRDGQRYEIPENRDGGRRCIRTTCSRPRRSTSSAGTRTDRFSSTRRLRSRTPR
jgi:arylsulfatase A-like enzyme